MRSCGHAGGVRRKSLVVDSAFGIERETPSCGTPQSQLMTSWQTTACSFVSRLNFRQKKDPAKSRVKNRD